MSFRLEMLQVARLAPEVLGDAAGLVISFLHRCEHPDGGFRDRDGRQDLYYSVFGVEGLLALRAEPRWPALNDWLQSFGDGDGLDFIHLCSLARLRASVPRDVCPHDPAVSAGIRSRLDQWRAGDGGFHQRQDAAHSSAYACLLGCAAVVDTGGTPPDPAVLSACLASLRSPDGGWANEPGLPAGTTPATAAAVALHRLLRRSPDPAAADWLLDRLHPDGGFRASPNAPLPDLLSTAVALHALDGMQANFAPHKDSLLDFLDSLWNADGGFHGHWADDTLDPEYTYYGLLALGHLAL